METESVSEVSGPHDMEAIEEKNHNFFNSAYEYQYKIEDALTYNKRSCVTVLQFTYKICCWIGNHGLHDMEDIENTAIILY